VNEEDIRSEVRWYYTRAARQGGDGYGHDGVWGASRYDTDTLADAPSGAVELSMGCGNPLTMIDLAPGETVLDLGSGGGLDVILSARRVGPTGIAYGLDELHEMIDVARAHAASAGVTNAVFLKGLIEDVPLPDASVDVVISNCVICLAPDKTPVFTEIARVLRPGGRMAVTDIVAENGYTPPQDDGAWAECGIGALQHDQLLAMIASVSLVDASIEYTHETGPGLHGATIRARRPLAVHEGSGSLGR
jgi:arsenite methyltransferase